MGKISKDLGLFTSVQDLSHDLLSITYHLSFHDPLPITHHPVVFVFSTISFAIAFENADGSFGFDPSRTSA